jgi:hypothetical protein
MVLPCLYYINKPNSQASKITSWHFPHWDSPGTSQSLHMFMLSAFVFIGTGGHTRTNTNTHTDQGVRPLQGLESLLYPCLALMHAFENSQRAVLRGWWVNSKWDIFTNAAWTLSRALSEWLCLCASWWPLSKQPVAHHHVCLWSSPLAPRSNCKPPCQGSQQMVNMWTEHANESSVISVCTHIQSGPKWLAPLIKMSNKECTLWSHTGWISVVPMQFVNVLWRGIYLENTLDLWKTVINCCFDGDISTIALCNHCHQVLT